MHILRALDEGSVVGTISIKKFTVVGKIDGNPSTVGGLLGDCQRGALTLVLVKENKTGRRVCVLGVRTCKILRTKVAVKCAIQVALVHYIVEDCVIEKNGNLHIHRLVILE